MSKRTLKSVMAIRYAIEEKKNKEIELAAKEEEKEREENLARLLGEQNA